MTEPYLHDLDMVAADATLSASAGLVPGWGAELVVPFRVNRQRITFRTLEGVPFTPDPPDYHHANRTLTGLGDPWLVIVGGIAREPWSFGGRVGATVPLGSTEPNPFTLGDLGLPHEHVQLGTGTVNPIVGLSVARDFGAFSLTGIGFARFGVWTNRHGYRTGHQYVGALTAIGSLGLERWRFGAGPALYHETAETWDGVVEEEGNLGRTDWYAEGRAQRVLSGGWSVGGEVRVPLHVEATGSQLELPPSLRLSVSRMFGGMIAP